MFARVTYEIIISTLLGEKTCNGLKKECLSVTQHYEACELSCVISTSYQQGVAWSRKRGEVGHGER